MKPISDINTPSDMSAFWMPFTANQQFKAAPRILKSAEGMYYHSEDGRKILDGTAGLWCCNAGHGRREIAEAVSCRFPHLDFAPTFQMGHPCRSSWPTGWWRSPQGARPRLLYQLRFGIGGYRAQDRAGLAAGARPGHPYPADLP